MRHYRDEVVSVFIAFFVHRYTSSAFSSYSVTGGAGHLSPWALQRAPHCQLRVLRFGGLPPPPSSPLLYFPPVR
jgi:hypothetical protein